MAPQVCCRNKLNRAQKTNLVNKVRMDYRIHMIMDNLPAATKMIAEMPDGTKKDMYDRCATQSWLGLGLGLGLARTPDERAEALGSATAHTHGPCLGQRLPAGLHRQQGHPGH